MVICKEAMPTNEKIESIRGRLKQARCSLCHGWVTPVKNRVPSSSVGEAMCSCPRGVHASDNPDVNGEDVECLLAEVDRMRAAFEATLATLRDNQHDAREHEARGNLTVASIAVEDAINVLRCEFLKDQ